ncbi:hypothetical protein [Erythrobacter crassostreae]|uniref:Phytoene synthase n=1 Tax=Erythrobacter crassostreae TaxID=2828328 RepID=A0A9X1F6B7_9SPHN|nr:hypothetical protein [Erythrobacter crassostrea]MBV7260263.1 hypothetical protein [Erythrobacter crassostrea]
MAQSAATSDAVDDTSPLELPAELAIAIAHTPQKVRGRLTTCFALDQRLARIVAGTTEPILGQMRLAWWRDVLSQPAEERPVGDAVLDAVGAECSGHEAALIQMVDAWEVFVVAEKLDQNVATQFAKNRSAPLSALIGKDHPNGGGTIWAIADAASRVSDGEEQGLLIDAGLGLAGKNVARSKELRGIAVLDALALRALKRGGRPLMEGRGASITAVRAALFGS